MKSIKKKILVKKASGGPMTAKPGLSKVTPAQSKTTGAKVGESYRTAPIKTDTINTPIRQKLSEYATRGPEPKEYSKYSELKKAAAQPTMKKGGAMKKVMIKKQDGGTIGKTTEPQIARSKPDGNVSGFIGKTTESQMIKPKSSVNVPKRKPIPGPTDKEGKKLYQDSKVIPMKKGGSMSKMTMMKKGGAMKSVTIKKKK